MFSCHEWRILGNKNRWNCGTWEDAVLAIGFEYTVAYKCTMILLVMVSPGTNLVKSHESLSITSESQFKKHKES